jgi:hypothetical protein
MRYTEKVHLKAYYSRLVSDQYDQISNNTYAKTSTIEFCQNMNKFTTQNT